MIQNDADLNVTYAQSSTDSKQLKDPNGNAVVSVTTGQSVTVTNDVSAPTVSAVTTSASDATYGIGDVIPILIQFNEVVNVQGTPTIALETGTQTQRHTMRVARDRYADVQLYGRKSACCE